MTKSQERANALFHNAEILAPMVRASTTPLRLLALEYGADLVYTEEIVDRAITSTVRCYNAQLRTIDYVKKIDTFSPKVQKRMMARYTAEQQQSASKTQANDIKCTALPTPTSPTSLPPPPLGPVVLRILPQAEKGKLIYQIGTGESNLALPAVLHVYRDVDGFDINMGCPKKFSVSGGMGSALLQDPNRACDIITTLKRNLPADKPISCKIRLLKDTKSTINFVSALVNAGVNAITIHGRTVQDECTSSANWEELVKVVSILKTSACQSIPVVINGDLYTRNDMINIRKRCGADGVMLARPALYNTSIFRKPTHQQQGNNGNKGDNNNNIMEETRYGYDSALLLDKTQVIKDYVQYANFYHSNPKNIKYVICEMMNNRRAPIQIAYLMPQRYPSQQTINQICKCKSMEALCKVWDVRSTGPSVLRSLPMLSSLLSSNTSNIATTSTILQSNHPQQKNSNGEVADVHRYDDRYFLDPDALKVKSKEERKDLAVKVDVTCQNSVSLGCNEIAMKANRKHNMSNVDVNGKIFKKKAKTAESD